MIHRFEVGSVFDVPIELDVSMLLVVPLVAWAIATDVAGVVELVDAATGVRVSVAAVSAGGWPWLLGLLGATGLFGSVALHELGHSFVAIDRGYDIDGITLWFLGGVAQFAEEPDDWADELRIALAGPVVSVLLGGVGLGVLFAAPASVPRVRFLAGYLGVLNLVLAAFNMLPGFPMDGGRVLRALLSRNRTLTEATDIAATVGQLVAVCIGLAGLFSLNVFLLAIGVFVYLGASAEASQTRMRSAFEDTTVADLMTPRDSLRTVSPETTVDDLLDRMYRERHTGYPVVEDGTVVGVVTLADASEAAADTAPVSDVMSADLLTVSPDTPAFDALERLEQQDVGRLVVTDDGEMVGLVSRTDLLTALAVARRAPQFGRLPSGAS